jgi:PAS domain S-box-containing protein
MRGNEDRPERATLRALADEPSREREHQLRVLSELTSDCCWARWEYPDGTTRREWITGSFVRLTGYTPEEFEGLGREKLVHPDDLSLALRRVVGPPGISEHEFRIITKEGKVRWLHERMHVMEGDDGVLRVYGATRDITGRKNAEQALLESRERIHKAQQLEALGQLAGGVAHDFNNLLMVIIGYCDLLLDEGVRGLDPTRCAREIQRAAKRAASLTSQLLAFGRKQKLQPRVLQINEAVLKIAKMLDRLLPESIETGLGLAPDLPPVKADPGQLEQVIVNLLVNSRDAMPDGGRIHIETREVLVGEGDAPRHPAGIAGRYVMLGVSDTGHGMSAATRARVFEPFFTTKEVGEGTGLGLAAVYGSVTQSGGFVTVDSSPGAGARFEIYYPATEEAPRSERPDEDAGPPTGTETVLLVEDEASVRGMVADALRRLGYDVLEAARPVEALRIAGERGREIEVLVSDVVMPEMSGEALAGEIRSTLPGIHVVLMSGYSRESIGADALPDNGVVFLEKPFSPDRLAHTIRDLLDGS